MSNLKLTVDAIRYLLMVPAVLAGLFIATYLVLEIELLRAALFCPEEFRRGYVCYVGDWVSFPGWVFALSSMIGVEVTLISVALLAPDNKVIAALAVFVIGVLIATLFLFASGLLLAYLVSLLAGFLTVYVVGRLTGTTIRYEVDRIMSRAGKF